MNPFDFATELMPQSGGIAHNVLVLILAAALGAALGIVRPVRSEIIPRSAHVIHAQILLSIVGAMIIVVVAESLARAFAIVGAAGLVRYRAKIKDPKDAGVMLVALAVGLTTGSGLFLFAAVSTVFVIGVLWSSTRWSRKPGRASISRSSRKTPPSSGRKSSTRSITRESRTNCAARHPVSFTTK
jgi:uncharacterized membrane protein YhiD involved in acid resistance